MPSLTLRNETNALWLLFGLLLRPHAPAEFGAGYALYRAHTGGILPRIAHVR